MFETGQRISDDTTRQCVCYALASSLGLATAVPASLRVGHFGWKGRIAGCDVRRGAHIRSTAGS